MFVVYLVHVQSDLDTLFFDRCIALVAIASDYRYLVHNSIYRRVPECATITVDLYTGLHENIPTKCAVPFQVMRQEQIWIL